MNPAAKILATLSLAAAMIGAGTGVHAAPGATDLPDIGSPADSILTRSKAETIGRSMVVRLREQGLLLEDPELHEYINSLGSRLAAHAHEGGHRFRFFVVNDSAVNAFALPGGYIGINSGLILQTKTESELAGVLAHEIAHVTQNHIARRAQAQGRASVLATAAVLASIVVGAATGADPETIQASAMAAQGMAVQQTINYTRENEYEADRVGVRTLAEAGFNPQGMPDFFETMGRLSGSMANRIPEFLLTHPVSATRIAETRGRVEKMKPGPVYESPEYPLMKARLRVLHAASGRDAVDWFESRIERLDDEEQTPESLRYGKALALLKAGKPDQAVPVMYDLHMENEASIPYYAGLGQAQVASRQGAEGLLTFQQAMGLFPRNVPLTVRYAEALMVEGQYDEAHKVLLDLFNLVPPTPPQVQLIANAASAAGDTAESYYYLAEYHLMSGQVTLAAQKLQLALGVPGTSDIQRSRFQARLNEITPYLPKKQRPRPMDQSRRAG